MMFSRSAPVVAFHLVRRVPRLHAISTRGGSGGCSTAFFTPARPFFSRNRSNACDNPHRHTEGEELHPHSTLKESRRSIPCYSEVEDREGADSSSPIRLPTREDMQRVRCSPPIKSEVREEIEEQIKNIVSSSLKPYDRVFQFTSDVTNTMPMVMLLGNHSSGKSTLINYLCGRDIQTTGVAPTDDGFTIIRRGEFDMNDDGPTAVSNPNYQFQALQPFGLSFITRFKVKTRTMPPTSGIPFDMMLVDTPGMIDTPVHVADRTSLDGQLRGYDFLAATRWFAQRSDVILLMFDPANPGTTGETLDVLTKSLYGFEHKFILVLNKVDVFEKVTDYARAYGALCWNLSKVITMKDMPLIYNTCTPLKAEDGTATSRPVVMGDGDVEWQRSKVLEEIFAAPLRRLDNLITETEDGARSLLLASQVSRTMKWEFQQHQLLVLGSIALLCVAAPAVVFALSSISFTGAILSTLGFIAAGFVSVIAAQNHLREYECSMANSCDVVFDRLVSGKDRTPAIEARWRTVVKPEIVRAVTSQIGGRGGQGIAKLPSNGARVCRHIATVIDTELPALRTRISVFKQEQIRERHEMINGKTPK